MERLSVSERSELWDLWEAGESQRAFARALERSPSTIRTHLVSSGWRRPSPPRDWCPLRLSLGEREEISRDLARDESLRSIADRLGTSPSTVSREVKINGGHLKYRATVAHQASRRRAKRPKAMKLQECPRLRVAVWFARGFLEALECGMLVRSGDDRSTTSSSANWGRTDDDMDRLEAAFATDSRPECVPEDAHFVPVTR